MKSWSARMLAVRRVTQDNRGKKTAGVDGVKSLTPKQRLALVDRLRRVNNRKAKPVRRVWIDKPGRTEKRPLGIPTMDDRAAQALAKAALEPEWEAKFEPNSYGFRPGRSCHDAIEAIFQAINRKSKFVLDADIAKCFDRINHEALLKKLNTFPTMRGLIKSWLKAGVVDWSAYANRQKGYSPTSEGTPQGGVISPLLANIALHGLENRLKQFAGTLPGRGGFGKRDNMKQLSIIRYADDFVILHPDESVVQRCQQITADWLKDIGLELKPEKTRLSHTLNPTEEGNVGFNFLGFTIKQFEVGKYASKQGFKTIITPSNEAVKLHLKRIGSIIQQHKTAPKQALIARLNPVIRGWSNYLRGQCSKETFQRCDYITYQQLRWFYSELRKVAHLETKSGNDTYELRQSLGLKKSKQKLSNKFEAHCVDSWVLANWYVEGHAEPDNTKLIEVIPLEFHRRQLHRLQHAPGHIRPRYGGTLSPGFKRGSIVKHPRYRFCYVGGWALSPTKKDPYRKTISLHSLNTGKRLCQNAMPTDCKFLSYNSWRSRQLICKAVLEGRGF